MKTRIFLACLGFLCFLGSVAAVCDLKDKKAVEQDFPDILKYVGDSYIMGVEYSTPKADETAYFTEYYEVLFKKGRVESHIRGSNEIYIYHAESEESWTLLNGKCNYQNITGTPDFFKNDQTDWSHYKEGNLTTVGPSAMLKVAYDVWNNENGRKDRMAYMGESKELIRGEKAVYWRRCTNDKKDYVDYYFADQKNENPFDSELYGKQVTPLRVSFYGVSESTSEELSVQHNDIISFQHVIPVGVEPFQLPKGKNCTRSQAIEGPKIPDFSSSNLFLKAEVVYQKFEAGKDDPLGTYYSTLTFALDRRSNHLSYRSSSWNLKQVDEDGDKILVNPPEYVVYDITHGYAYVMSPNSGVCRIDRNQTYIPKYNLPNNAGALDLTNPYVLLPNNEMSYLTTGRVRGMDVNIYETTVDNFIMGNDDLIPKALVTHSYLKSNEKMETQAEVAGPLIQIDVRLFRKDKTEDLVTFNLYGVSTEIPQPQRVFDVTRCYRNYDDYAIFTIGFEIEPKYLPKIASALPQIEESTISAAKGRSELNSVRIPYSMSNLEKEYAFVTMVVLDKPDPHLDFNADAGKTITVASVQDDTDGISTFKSCANKCLERRSNCWGFSMCGDNNSGTCYYGSDTNTNVVAKTDCSLYTRFTNKTYMQTKELQIEELRRLIGAGEFMISAVLENGERVQFVASYSRVDDPAENDLMFRDLGNKMNPRLTVQKAATKLKKGTEVKNLGQLSYEECQSLCLDFKDCETVSYCMKDSACTISTKYGSELKDGETEADNFCILLTRKYTDHFEHTPGVFVKAAGGGTQKEVKNVEECSKACLKESGINCLSFDHCMLNDKQTCTLFTTHYLSRKDKADATSKDARCGHYTKKVSYDFTRKDETRLLGSTIPSLSNLTLQECAKTCVDYGEGSCYGYDFCQDATLYGTICTLFDKDPSRLESMHNSMCTNYIRSQGVYEARPFTNSYAGGIGFLCFAVGGIIGAIAVFAIAYLRVNRRG